jgi:trans-aconitate methyltransferase
MTNWSGGYHTEVPYFANYYREQAPVHLAVTATICGADSPSPSRPYHYLELGCGLGLTLNLLAAANPHATFHGIDFIPVHIVRAQQLAAAAGLENVTFHEAGFEEWDRSPPPGLPPFEFITAHGIYSWVSEGVRASIRALFRRHLATGGLAALSYNGLPGQATTIPIQRILWDYSRQRQGGPEARIVEAVSFLTRYHEALLLKSLDENVIRRLNMRIQKGQTTYLVHEMLTENWTPHFPQDVIAEMAESKLDFVGDADLMQNIIELMLPEALRALFAEVTDAGLRQCLLDLVNARVFRKDVYARGLSRMPQHRRIEGLNSVLLALTAPASRLSMQVRIPVGSADLDEASYRPIFAALAEGPRSAQELGMISRQNGGGVSVLEIVGSLVSAEYALPLAAVEAGQQRVQRYARAWLDWCRLDDLVKGCPLPSGIGGGGVLMDLFEFLAFVGIAEGVTPAPLPLAEHAWRLLVRRGEHLTKDGRPLTERQDAIALLQENFERALRECVQMWKVLRML